MRGESDLFQAELKYKQMEMLTWFGRFDLLTGSLLASEEADGVVKPQHQPASSFSLLQPDLRSLAKACGFVADDEEYNHRLREAALGLVRRNLLARTTAEQDLLE